MDELKTKIKPCLIKSRNHASQDDISVIPEPPVKPSSERNLDRACLAAIGTYGRHVLETICASEPFPGKLVCIQSNGAYDEQPWTPVNIAVNPSLTSDPDAIAAALYEDRGEAARAMSGYELVIVLADMGDVEGRAIAPSASSFARAHSRTVIGFAAMPFEFEGVSAARAAKTAIEDWRKEAHSVIEIRRERLGGVTSEEDNVETVIRSGALWVAEGARALAAVASTPLTLTPSPSKWTEFLGEGEICHAGWGSVPGGESLEQAAELALGRSFLTHADMLSAGPVLIQIVSNRIPTVQEVTRLSAALQDRTGRDADFRFAFGRDENLVNRTLCAVFVRESSRRLLQRQSASPSSESDSRTAKVKNGAGIFGLQNRHTPRLLNLDVPTFLRRKCA
jgi:cell division GTPase FtsZ